MVVHLGARTDTAEQDVAIFDELNLNYSKRIWEICTRHQIPLVYASSAATYGDGAFGYDDDHANVSSLHPLNPYGESKQDFDLWVLEQTETPPFWAGVKFFNVYGPNEYHKGRMASVIFHTFHQIQKTGGMKLFRSHRADVQGRRTATGFCLYQRCGGGPSLPDDQRRTLDYTTWGQVRRAHSWIWRRRPLHH